MIDVKKLILECATSQSMNKTCTIDPEELQKAIEEALEQPSWHFTYCLTPASYFIHSFEAAQTDTKTTE